MKFFDESPNILSSLIIVTFSWGQKKRDYFGKCDYLNDCDYLGIQGFCIEGINSSIKYLLFKF